MNPMLLIALVLLAYAAFTGTLIGPLRNWQTDPNETVGFLIAIFLGITVHEFMHAYVAHSLGDDTGRLLGRLTLNPLAHFDLFGTLLLVLAGFGYGKPVPFNESRLRGPGGVALVAVAGPLSNLAIAAICAIPLRFAATGLGGTYGEVLAWIVYWNCVLGIFNLVPIPPLDGSNVVYGLLPPRQQYTWRQFQQYGPMLLLALLFFGGRILFQVVFGPAQSLANLLVGTRLF
jgi:Zn-dependent protease